MTKAYHRHLDVLCSDPVRLLENSIRNNFGARLKRWALVVGAPYRCASRIGLRSGSAPFRLRPRHRLAPAWKAGRWICPRTECRYHLAEFVDAPKVSPGCALLIADRGGMCTDVLGRLLGLTRQRADQLEAEGLSRLDLVRGLREFVERPESVKVRLTTEELILSALKVGPSTADRIARDAKIHESMIRRALRTLEERALVYSRDVGPRGRSRMWHMGRVPIVD